jgi:hypothetical protein
VLVPVTRRAPDSLARVGERLGRRLSEVSLFLREPIHVRRVGAVKREQRIACGGELGARRRVLARGAVQPAPVGEVIDLPLPVARPQVPGGERIRPLELEAEGPRPLVLLPVQELHVGEADAERSPGRQRAGGLPGPRCSLQASRDAQREEADPEQDDDEVRDPQRGPVWAQARIARGHARDCGTRRRSPSIGRACKLSRAPR